MTELTKEYFDEQIGKLATKVDLEKGVEELAAIIATTIAEPMERHFQEVKKELDVAEEPAHPRLPKVVVRLDSSDFMQSH